MDIEPTQIGRIFGPDLDGVTEFEALAENVEDAPTSIAALT